MYKSEKVEIVSVNSLPDWLRDNILEYVNGRPVDGLPSFAYNPTSKSMSRDLQIVKSAKDAIDKNHTKWFLFDSIIFHYDISNNRIIKVKNPIEHWHSTNDEFVVEKLLQTLEIDFLLKEGRFDLLSIYTTFLNCVEL